MADKADRSVLMALILEKFDDQELGPQDWPFFCLPDLVADCRENGY